MEDDPSGHLGHGAGHLRVAPRPDPDDGAGRPLHHARVPQPVGAHGSHRRGAGCADRARRPLRRRAPRRPRSDRLRVRRLEGRRAGRRPGVRPDGPDERRRDRRPAGHRLPRRAAVPVPSRHLRGHAGGGRRQPDHRPRQRRHPAARARAGPLVPAGLGRSDGRPARRQAHPDHCRPGLRGRGAVRAGNGVRPARRAGDPGHLPRHRWCRARRCGDWTW